MSTANDTELSICSFCEQVIQIKREHIGRRTGCPKCRRAILLFPNKDLNIDDRLSSTWYYRRERLLLRAEDIGPISDEQFVELVRQGDIRVDTEICSQEITRSQWVPAATVKLEVITERIDQRAAERQRRSKREIRKRE
ncbi:MAG TPA: hypothetical protein VE170_10590, partial [Candidatus Limnocylindria bacterium]|nr:hypothetical protein [Candidatus Limnocylindria bacterium]